MLIPSDPRREAGKKCISRCLLLVLQAGVRRGQGDGVLSLPARGQWVRGGSDGRKMAPSVTTGHTEEGTASSAWGVGGEEAFTNEKPREVDFENQVVAY